MRRPVLWPLGLVLLLACLMAHPASAADGVLIFAPDVVCGDNGADVSFSWQPPDAAESQWLEVSRSDNGFIDGTYGYYGPMDGEASSFVWPGLIAGQRYFWRVAADTPDGTLFSETGSFVPCADAVSTPPEPPAAEPAPVEAASVDGARSFDIVDADLLEMPAPVDSNSPAFWHDGVLYLFNSTIYGTFRSNGYSPDALGDTVQVEMPRPQWDGGVWFEAMWYDADAALLYGWYHFEQVFPDCQPVPSIGAAVSSDDGLTWEDRGLVLTNGYDHDCAYDNQYISGGNGDFSVIVGPDSEYFYFLFSNYAGPLEEQGVDVARGAFEARGQPGTVFKYYDGGWTEPGLGGRATAILASSTGWKGPYVEAFWGPAVQWNTYLGRYVALLNHTAGENYIQEGIYITYSEDLLDWSPPERLIDADLWYPEALGLGPDDTDSRAGQTMRIYLRGVSTQLLSFR